MIFKIGKLDCVKVVYTGETLFLGNYILKEGDTGIIPLDIWKYQANTKYSQWKLYVIPEEGENPINKILSL